MVADGDVILSFRLYEDNRTSSVSSEHAPVTCCISVLTLCIVGMPCTDGEQSFFPVYEPTQEELKARYKVAEGGPMVDHYDAKKEGTNTIRLATSTRGVLTRSSFSRLRHPPTVRTKGAGFYQFAQDEEVRRRQMEELKQQRDETEQARAGSNPRGGSDGPAGPVLSAAQEAKKRKLDERRALIEAKRQKVSLGVDWQTG